MATLRAHALWIPCVLSIAACDPPCIVGNLCGDDEAAPGPDEDTPDFECADGGVAACVGGVIPCDLVIHSEAGMAVLDGCPVVDGSLTFSGEGVGTPAQLPPVSEIKGALRVVGTALTDLDGAEGVGSLAALEIESNPHLEDVAALAQTDCSSVSGGGCASISLVDDPALADFSALGSVEDLQYLYIRDVPSLSGLSGLAALERVGAMRIQDVGSLASLSPLAALREIGGGLMIDDCDALTDLDGLSGVTSIGADGSGYIGITLNDSLTSVDGLLGVDAMSGGVTIERNALLPTCDAEALCDHLAGDAGWATPGECYIEDNLADECSE